MKKTISLFALCTVALTAVSCQSSPISSSSSSSSSSSASSPLLSSSASQGSLTITIPSKTTLTVGDTITLTANLSGATGSVVWKSSSESVATISQDGLVTAVAPGTTTITASLDTLSDSLTLTVEERKKTIEDVLPQFSEMALTGSSSFKVVYSSGYSEQVERQEDIYWREDRFVYATRFKDGTPYESFDYYDDGEGNVGEKKLDPTTNETSIETVVDYSGKKTTFKPYVSPFASLTSEDLRETADGIEIDASEEILTDLGDFLTGRKTTYPIQRILLLVDDNYTVQGIQMTGKGTDVDTAHLTDVDIDGTVTLSVVSKAEIGVKEILPRTQDEKNVQDLQDLFDDLKKLNFTITLSSDNSQGEQKYLVNEDHYLTTTATGVTSGLVETDSYGVLSFEVQDGKMVGNSVIRQADTFASLFPSFDVLATMFDVTGATYTLAPDLGLDEYITDILPIPKYTGFSTLCDDGSLKFTDNGDGTWDIGYSYTSTDRNGTESVAKSKIVLSDIGTTDTGFDGSDYIAPKMQESWSEVPGITEDLTKNLPGGDINALPFYKPDDGSLYQWYGSYSFLNLQTASDEIATKALEGFGTLLVDAGWVYDEVNSTPYGYIYIYTDGDFNYKLSLSTIGTILMVSAMSPVINYKESELSDWLKENFGDAKTINYTADFDSYVTRYNAVLDGTSYVKGEEIESRHQDIDATTKVTPNSYYSYVSDDDQTIAKALEDGTTDVYDTNSYYESGWVKTNYDMSLTETIYTMYDAAQSICYLPVENGDYITQDRDLIDTFMGIARAGYAAYPTELNFHLDEENKILTVTYELSMTAYDYDTGKMVIQEVETLLTIHNIGTTTLDVDQYIPTEFDVAG